MWQYDALLVIHVLLIVLWLGPDFVSWYVAWLIRVPKFDWPIRLQIVDVLRVIDQFSRNSTILLIPTGIGLMRLGGWGLQGVPEGVLWLATGVCIIWAGANFWFTALQKSFHGLKGFFLADQALRLAVAIAALILLASSFGEGGIETSWLMIKVGLFIGIMIAAIVAFALPNPFLILGQIQAEGSTPEREHAFTHSIDKIMSIVVGINTAMVVMIIVALTRL